MSLFSNEAIAAIRWLIANLSKLQAMLSGGGMPNITGSGAAKVTSRGNNVSIHVDPGVSSTSPQRVGEMAIIKVTGNEIGVEKYTCDVFRLNDTDFFDPGVSFNQDTLGIALIQNAIFVNLQGSGGSGHSLTHADNTDQISFLAWYVGPSNENPSRPVYTNNAAWFDSCPPTP